MNTVARAEEIGTSVIDLDGEIDLLGADSVDASVAVAMQAASTKLVLDMSKVVFIDAQGINAMLRALGLLEESGGELWLRAPSRPVVRLIDLVGLDTVLRSEAA